MPWFFNLIILTTLVIVGCSSAERTTDSTGASDPYIWLEDIEAKKSLDWVNLQNEKSQAVLGKGKRFVRLETLALQILEAEDKIPSVEMEGSHLVNFWQDPDNVRGLWRRTTFDSFKQKDPDWDIILDIDLLAKNENENWIFRGANCLAPRYELCLVSLSKGGKDAVVIREFNTKKRAFVAKGFEVPEAKSEVDWLDSNTLLVATDFGEGTLTDSGYPRIVKKWKRGTSLKDAPVLMEVAKTDLGVSGYVLDHVDGKIPIISKQEDMFSTQNWVYLNSELAKLPVPSSLNLNGYFKGYFILTLRKDWVVDNREFSQGSLVAVNKNVVKNKVVTDKDVKLLYNPPNQASIMAVATLKDRILINVLENVKGEIYEVSANALGFTKPQKAVANKDRHLTLGSTSSFRNDFFYNSSSLLQPNALYYMGGTPEKETVMKSLPARFDNKGMTVQQLWATSSDGTKIPYFVVGKESQIKKGSAPTLLYGYGGFQVPVTPEYKPEIGKLWLERGGLFVIANIRGGGEFGPQWHQSALKTNRNKSYEDFIAVAEDMIKRKITVKDKLAITGRSNGGLLVGAVMAQRPDLFKAVVCGVPLLDMFRYNQLLAGASWMSEYGDPKDSDIRDFWTTYSPYQKINEKQTYPDIFIYTSTKDDRVHPGHARKMTAKLLGFEKNKVFYYENLEGGHAGSANLKQKALMTALSYEFLYQQLF